MTSSDEIFLAIICGISATVLIALIFWIWYYLCPRRFPWVHLVRQRPRTSSVELDLLDYHADDHTRGLATNTTRPLTPLGKKTKPSTWNPQATFALPVNGVKQNTAGAVGSESYFHDRSMPAIKEPDGVEKSADLAEESQNGWLSRLGLSFITTPQTPESISSQSHSMPLSKTDSRAPAVFDKPGAPVNSSVDHGVGVSPWTTNHKASASIQNPPYNNPIPFIAPTSRAFPPSQNPSPSDRATRSTLNTPSTNPTNTPSRSAHLRASQISTLRKSRLNPHKRSTSTPPISAPRISPRTLALIESKYASIISPRARALHTLTPPPLPRPRRTTRKLPTSTPPTTPPPPSPLHSVFSPHKSHFPPRTTTLPPWTLPGIPPPSAYRTQQHRSTGQTPLVVITESAISPKTRIAPGVATGAAALSPLRSVGFHPMHDCAPGPLVLGGRGRRGAVGGGVGVGGVGGFGEGEGGGWGGEGVGVGDEVVGRGVEGRARGEDVGSPDGGVIGIALGSPRWVHDEAEGEGAGGREGMLWKGKGKGKARA